MEKNILFLDDIRNPGNSSEVNMCKYDLSRDGSTVNIILARSVKSAKRYCKKLNGKLYMASLDHDLGCSEDGMDFLKWLIRSIDDKIVSISDDFYVYPHTANIVAREQMMSYYRSWKSTLNDKDRLAEWSLRSNS